MAQHKMVTFRLHRTAVIFIILGALLLGVLIFVAGCVFGMRRPVAPALPAALPKASKPQAAATTTAPPPAPRELLTIRVAVFDSEEDAKALVAQLAARKMSASVVPVTTTGGVKLFTVQVGQYTSRAAAAAAAQDLADEPGLQPAVVPVGIMAP